MAAKAPVLRTTSAAVTVAVAAMSVCVVVAASLAAAAATVSGDPVAGLPLLMAARGGGSSSSRVEDEEPLEMDSEAHRRVVLALRGGLGLSPGNRALDGNKPWCEPPCTGASGEPYVRGCLKIYHCPGATNALSD
ncbi:hypothetical protein SETIT_9G401700v2 [Setaria italica]|uniref:Uncharacterized protein n=1 Tax=Setaria italica TaxID=4555 RepID=A0A368SQQ8_SETIT|nr:hypothetical protein SETIT_9G401700v2 [Setaria italica]